MRIRTRASAATTAILLVAAAAASASLGANPANQPSLLGTPIESFRYDDADRCTEKVPTGTKALAKWLARHVPRGVYLGAYRCEKDPSFGFSIHSESRAIDFGLDAGSRRDKAAADALIEMLFAVDKEGESAALARRMGVQGVIWNCRAWYSHTPQPGEPPEMAPYWLCYDEKGERIPNRDLDKTQAHRDHIHIELNRPGADAKTSFWRSPLANQ